MSRLCTAAQGCAIAALGVWLGAAMTSAITAAVAFPTMKTLSPTLVDFGAYAGPHAPIAAGAIARRVFDIAAFIQIACAAVAGLTLGLATLRPKSATHTPGPIPWLRTLLLVLAIGILAYWRLVLAPRMDANLDAFWAAAKAGQSEIAERAHGAFSRDHPHASRTLGTMTLLVLLTILESTRVLATQSISGAGSREHAP